MLALFLLGLVLASAPALCSLVEVPAAIISSLVQHFHSKCIFFLEKIPTRDNTSLSKDFQTLLLRKTISSSFSTMVGSLHSVNKLDDQCSLSLPLYVIWCWNPKTCLSLQMPKHVKASFGRWLVFLQHNSSLQELLTDFYIPFDCEFLVAEITSNRKMVLIREVYHIGQGLPLQIHQFGIWSSQEENFIWPNINLYNRRNKLNGHIIKVATLADGVFVTMTKKYDVELSLGGYIGNIWELLQQTMNFRSEYHLSLDGGTGAQLNNGSWDGLVGMLERDEVEIGASSFLMTQNRLDVLEYTTPLIEAGNNLYVRQRGIYSLPWKSFLAPFNTTVWLCILLSIVTLSIMLAITCEAEYYYQGLEHNTKRSPHLTFHDAWLYILGSFCLQGHGTTPESTSCRVIYITSYICAMVILAGYSGIYVSFLTKERILVPPFNTFEELLKDGSYKLGVSPRSAQLNFFNKATDPVLQDIYKRLINESRLPSTYEEGFQKVCNSQYVFMTSKVFKCRSSPSIICPIMSIPEAYIPGFVSMATVKNSPYRGLINYNLERMQEVALLKRIREHSLLQKDCFNSFQGKALENQKTWDTVSFEEVLPTICLFAMGVVISLLLLGAECWTKHKRRS